MILGVGTDLANIERIAGVLDRHGTGFETGYLPKPNKERRNAEKTPQGHMPNAGPQKKPAQKLLALACEWGSHGKTWPLET